METKLLDIVFTGNEYVARLDDNGYQFLIDAVNLRRRIETFREIGMDTKAEQAALVEIKKRQLDGDLEC